MIAKDIGNRQIELAALPGEHVAPRSRLQPVLKVWLR